MVQESGKRKRPNILVTGTPGTGKTTMCTALWEATQLGHINVEDLVREKNLHDDWDDELDCFILNEDMGFVLLNRTLARMLMRSLVFSSKLQSLSLRCFSSATPHVLKPGDVLRQARVFTEEDVLQYTKVTHDCNPLHTDSATARCVGFEGPLVHGMLVASLFPHIISSHFPGAVYVSQSLNFKFPVYIGDQICGEVQATNLRENKNRYLAKFKTRCFKNGELLVIEGEAVAMLPTLTVEQGQCKEQ